MKINENVSFITMTKKTDDTEEESEGCTSISQSDFENMPEYKFLQDKLGDKLNQAHLLPVAQFLANRYQIQLPRPCKRNKGFMYGWFHENWEKILPGFEFITKKSISKVERDAQFLD